MTESYTERMSARVRAACEALKTESYTERMSARVRAACETLKTERKRLFDQTEKCQRALEDQQSMCPHIHTTHRPRQCAEYDDYNVCDDCGAKVYQ